ncbi:MAG TPA: Uma2 family endonuclease [Acidobacteriota bacterium]|jgi:Uma2 family endonuclease
MENGTPSRVKFTYQDYLLFPDDGKRHELIDGEHFVTPSPIIKHQRISITLSTALKVFLKYNGLGEVFAAPCDVVLSEVDVVEPDLLVVLASHASIITEKNIQGAPDLVIEILSEGTRKTDEVIKRKLYERFGVGEYWIVDPELETIKIYRLTDKRFARQAELSREAGDALSTPLLPGLQIPLSEIFR